jgi:hypothetical protein
MYNFNHAVRMTGHEKEDRNGYGRDRGRFQLLAMYSSGSEENYDTKIGVLAGLFITQVTCVKPGAALLVCQPENTTVAPWA